MTTWFQKNAPRSPWAKQRSFFTKIFVLYVLVSGGLIMAYSPAARRIKKEIEDEKEIEYFVNKRREFESNRFFGPYSNLAVTTTKEEFLQTQREKERMDRGDTDGPDVSEERIRMMIAAKNKGI